MEQNISPFKRHALLIIVLAMLPLMVVGGMNFTVDPLQIYRKQNFGEPRFYSDQRFQNAGKIKSYLPNDDYKTIIIGHSHSDNFIPSKVQMLLKSGKTLKLTIGGSTPREQYLMVSQALEKGNINTVIWGIGANFKGNDPYKYNKRRLFPHYLYSESIFDDSPYLLSLDILQFSFEQLQGKLGWETDLDMLNYWMDRRVKSYAVFNSKKNLRKLENRLAKIKQKSETLPQIKGKRYPNVKVNLLPIIKKYPNVNFVLFFTPSYYLRYTNVRLYLDIFSLQQTVVDAMDQFPNVRVFGFDDYSTIGGNAANYRDMGHYHSGVNMYILQAIRDDRHRLTSSNFAEYESIVRRNILRFKIYSDFETMIPMALPRKMKY
jgi:hypothetical protein